VPSLQVTGAADVEEPEEELALDAAEDDPDEDPEAGAAAPEEPPAAAVADLSTPPWPLQAPRPLWVAVVPSLHTGLAEELLLELVPLLPLALCASESPGAVSSAATNTVPHVKPLSIGNFICRSPHQKAVV
jgi:hypothetical protein